MGDFIFSLTEQQIAGAELGGRISGSRFWFSWDRQYVLKTTKRHELETLCKLLDEYTDFLESNPDSLMTRYLGAYEISIGGKREMFMVMNNAIRSPVALDCIYDLKGSTEGRYTKPRPGAVLKDLNMTD